MSNLLHHANGTASLSERVARAIFESGQRGVRYDDLRRDERREWLAAARAAVAAVRKFEGREAGA